MAGKKFCQHARFPRNVKGIADAQGRAVGVGSCGDALEVNLRIDDETIIDIGVMPDGCAYTVACASALSILVRGKTLDAALALQPEDVEQELDGLPEDHKHCARLAVNTLGEAIADVYKAMPHTGQTPPEEE